MKIEMTINDESVSTFGNMGQYIMYANEDKETIYFVNIDGDVVGWVGAYLNTDSDIIITSEEY